jgi:hypothetical protein
VAETARQWAEWRAWAVNAPKATARFVADGAPAAPSDEVVLAFILKRLAAKGPTALLYIDGLKYESSWRATVAPTSLRGENMARRAAEVAGVPFFATGDYLVEAVRRSGQPPYGFANALLPGGHLNDLGHQAVARALVDMVSLMRPALPSDCSK